MSTTDTDAEPDEQVTMNRRELAALTSTLVQRAAVAARMGESWGHLDERDYFKTLGYPEQSQVDVRDYYAQFQRGGIATTIIEAPAGQTWNDVPNLTDDGSPEEEDEQSAFETDVQTLFDEKQLLNYLDTADTLQRIGRYGILLVGFDDGNPLDEPLDTSALRGDPEEDILYFQAFSEKDVDDFTRVEDEQDERFGRPKMYEGVDFGDEGIGTKDVHHSRVLHIAEGALEDNAIGRPALESVFNYLLDLLKVVGGSSEMFWRDAKKRFIANLDPEAGGFVDEEDLQEQVEEFVHELRDVVQSRGLEIEEIEGGSPDPSGIKDALLELIAGVTRIPKRRLLGTERGDLASTQDEAAFVGMIEERRRKFAEPMILRKLFDWFVDIGIVSEPAGGSYEVDWPDLFELTELEKAELKQRLAKAYKDVSSMGDPAEIATPEERREEVLDLPPERGSAVESPETPADPEADEPLDETDPEVEDVFDEIFGDGDEPGVDDVDPGEVEAD